MVARELRAVALVVGLAFGPGCERVATSSPHTSASVQPTVEVSDPKRMDTASRLWEAVFDTGVGQGKLDCKSARQKFYALPAEQRRDAWGYEMVVYCDAHDWSVVSRGADGRLVTADDMSMERQLVLMPMECGLDHN